MFCSKCGTKNEEGAKFCSKCGEALTESTKKEETVKVSNPNSDAGGIRKAMKADAKKRVKGALIGATAIYLVVCAILGGLSGGTTATTDTGFNVSYQSTSMIVEIITMLIGLVFSFGLIYVSFKALRDEEYKFTDVFVKPFERLKALGYVLLLAVIVFVATFVLMIIPIIGWIAFIVLLIYFTPVLTIYIMMLADPKAKDDMSFVDIFKKAMEITKGNRIEFYGLVCSFIPWILLAPFTLGILFIWLVPYMEMAEVNLYRKWTGEETFASSETGLSNGAVIGITTGGCGCGCILAITVFAAAIATIIAGLGIASDNPDIQGFLDKYIQEGNNSNDVDDFWNNYNSGYNS